MTFMRRAHVFRQMISALAAGASLVVLVAARDTRHASDRRAPDSRETSARVQFGSLSESWTDLPPILLPESAAPSLAHDDQGRAKPIDVVLAFIVDTLGRAEREGIETLSATDSAAALAARGSLTGIRYVPRRLVANGSVCVRFNGATAHCGGTAPILRRLRARVVLRIEAGN
jgi:hypothetical protein